MIRKYALFTALALLFGLAQRAEAAGEESRVKLQSVAETEIEIVRPDGEKEVRRVPAAKVIPGEIVIYTNTFTNISDEPVEKIALTNPVPEHMTYLPGSAFGEDFRITFSVDGGATYAPPEELKVMGKEGNARAASPEEYTHIRWQLPAPLPPGETGQVGFRARLD